MKLTARLQKKCKYNHFQLKMKIETTEKILEKFNISTAKKRKQKQQTDMVSNKHLLKVAIYEHYMDLLYLFISIVL